MIAIGLQGRDNISISMGNSLVFAIITFRDSGPIKSWTDMRGTSIHNARTKPIDHGVEGAPPPRFLVGTADLVADVKKQYRVCSIDPDAMRGNGVYAYEAILSASPEFFEQGDEAAKAERLEAWVAVQVEWARVHYGAHRVVSMVLHLDEKTPHIHLVVLPLEVVIDKRRKEEQRRWSLVGRTISGPGRFEEAQDAYAAAMAAFGLVRGVRGSGRKHEPVKVYLARMEAKERVLDEARAAVERDADALAAERARLAALEQQLARDRAEFDEEMRRRSKRFNEERAKQRAIEGQQRDARAEIEATRTAAAADRDEARSVLSKTHENRARFRQNVDRLQETFAAAADFRRLLGDLGTQPLTAVASSTRQAVADLGRAATEIRSPAPEEGPGILGLYAAIRRSGSGLGG